MRKVLVLFALLFAALTARAQVNNPTIVPTATAPSGSCTANLPIKLKTPDGTLYTCQSGTWGAVGNGGGGIADIQITVSTTAIPANSCLPTDTTFNTATMTGLATTNAVSISPAGNLSAVTGWTPATPGLYFNAYPTSNTLNWQICNGSAGSITPGSSTTWNVSAQ